VLTEGRGACMTRELLEQYRDMKMEIMDMRYQLEFEEASMRYDTETRIEELIKRRKSLERECREVEIFIESIPDSKTRRIFEMYYVDGLKRPSQAVVGEKTNVDQSMISKKITEWLAVHERRKQLPCRN